MLRPGTTVPWLLLMLGCGASGPARQGRSGTYAQALDSATSACEQNPAYCAATAGQERIVPLAVRAAQVSAAGKSWMEIETLVETGIRERLIDCARRADAEVNREEFGGRSPTRADCEKVVGGTKENPVTGAMMLGRKKHALALDCAEAALGQSLPARFLREQRYRRGTRSQEPELVTHQKELDLLRAGASKALEGTVVPDLILHTGNPVQVQRVYDFKFPCPDTNPPVWRQSPPGNPLRARHQGDAYRMTFGTTPVLVTPRGMFP
ncbi:hypothetical protein HUA76_19785 [Myxococcus sp. CA056]|uniref:hypothetical protein n=1 Tax=unclassified Myxococcus TaxID=2648731 RepID=UPI00157AA2F3|nr:MULTISPECIES: hypothetical protein [unclassified Myxococcus]NTX13044.1 hypothetical protein [Myxococcus sp. CA056]NTX36505.1 hypothetical protein [Myxococcus sp. CA033]